MLNLTLTRAMIGRALPAALACMAPTIAIGAPGHAKAPGKVASKAASKPAVRSAVKAAPKVAAPQTMMLTTPDVEPYIDLGLQAVVQGKPDVGVTFLNQGLKIARGLKDLTGEGRCLFVLGVAYKLKKQDARALDYFQQSIAVSHAAHNVVTETVGCELAGMLAVNLNASGAARSLYAHTGSLLQHATDSNDNASSLIKLGDFGIRLHEYGSALAHLRSAREMADRLGNVPLYVSASIAIAMGDVGLYRPGLADRIATQIGYGTETDALDLLAETRPIFLAGTDLKRSAQSLHDVSMAISYLAANLSSHNQAQRYVGVTATFLADSARLARRCGDRGLELDATADLSGDQVAQGSYAIAFALVDRSMALLTATSTPDQRGDVLQAKGVALSLSGQPQAAIQPLEEAVEYYNIAGEKVDAAFANLALSDVYSQLGNGQAAKARSDVATQLMASGQQTEDEIEVGKNIAGK